MTIVHTVLDLFVVHGTTAAAYAAGALAGLVLAVLILMAMNVAYYYVVLPVLCWMIRAAVQVLAVMIEIFQPAKITVVYYADRTEIIQR